MPTVVRASSSFANLIVWCSRYVFTGQYHIDAIRVLVSKKLYVGETIKKLNKYEDLPWLKQGSMHNLDIERFRWFSHDQLAWSEQFPTTILDVRYATSPRSIYSLWDLKFSPQRRAQYVQFERLFEKK